MLGMYKFISVVIGAGALGTFIIVKTLGGDEGPAYVPAQINLAPKAQNTSWIDKRRAEDQRIRDQVAQRFKGAPEEVIDLASKIANPNVLLNSYTDELLALTRTEVNQGYGKPFPDTAPEYVHTLLREAVINSNTGAAALLLDRGADVHYNDNEMPFQAVNLQSALQDVEYWFPDYAVGSKFLRVWLDRGGDPNITHPLYGNGLGGILHHTPKNNLEGVLALLDFGADPWQTISVTSEDGVELYAMPSYFASLANGNRLYSEVAFRIAKEGHYKDGTEEGIDILLQAIESTSSRMMRSSGETAMNNRWSYKMALEQIFPQIGRSPKKDTRALMDERYPDYIGGFFLADWQVRSPKRADQEVVDRERQTGPHMWK